jgi:excisionase family DNA binding protein
VDRTRAEYTKSGRGRRAPSVALRHWEQACKARWRALLLVIRAKLEAVACGISTVEDESSRTSTSTSREHVRDESAMSTTSQTESVTLTMRQVRAFVNLGRTTIEKMVARGEFPRPRRVGGKLLFDRAEVLDWWQRQGADS